jgi:hypothetical protein
VVVLECSKKQWFVKTSPRDIAPVLFECPCRFSRFIQVSGVATSLFKIYSSFGRRDVAFQDFFKFGASRRRFSRFIQVSGVATSLFKIYSSFGRRDVAFQDLFKFRASRRRFSRFIQVSGRRDVM